MKRIIVLAVLLALATIAAAQPARLRNGSGGQAGPSREAIGKFDQLFHGATAVHWKNTGKVESVSFVFQNEYCIAYFSGQGDLLARGRKISESQLPLHVRNQLATIKTGEEKKHGPLSTANLYEFLKKGETSYYLTLDNLLVSLVVEYSGGKMVIRRKSDRDENPGKALLAQLD